MPTPCLVVLTARGTQRLLKEGGSQAWRLNPDNALRHTYCVCIQNRNAHWGGADNDHHQAFMIGRIKEIVPSQEALDRYLVVFSEYALIKHPDCWPKHRNPVLYANLEDFDVTDPTALTWHPMPPCAIKSSISQPAEDDAKESIEPLTIQKAKERLAISLGVPETAIEITVKF